MAEDTTTTTTTAAVTPKPSKKKKNKRAIPHGQFHVLATFNNTIVTFTDRSGGALTSASAGGCGFRGSKKGTAYAAQIATEKAAAAVKQLHGTTKVDVFVKGIGLGRDAAIRSLSSADISVDTITDVTGVAHGGTRPKKARRV